MGSFARVSKIFAAAVREIPATAAVYFHRSGSGLRAVRYHQPPPNRSLGNRMLMMVLWRKSISDDRSDLLPAALTPIHTGPRRRGTRIIDLIEGRMIQCGQEV